MGTFASVLLCPGLLTNFHLPRSTRGGGFRQRQAEAHCAAASVGLAICIRGHLCNRRLGRDLRRWGHRPAAPPPPWPTFPKFPLTHLWFLYVLLELYAAVLVLRAAVVRVDKTGRIWLGIDRLVALLVRNPLAPAVLALPVGIAFVADPKWLMWFGVRTPDSSLVTNAQAWIGFGTAFGFGWLLHRQMELIQTLALPAMHWRPGRRRLP